MRDRFHFTLPVEYLPSTEQKAEDDIEPSITGTICSDGESYYQFRKVFFQLLEEQYGHLSVKDLIGEDGNDMIVLVAFQEKLKSCSELEDFRNSFSDLFLLPEECGSLLQQLKNLFVSLFSKGSCQPEQMLTFILDEVSAFCFHLINVRINTNKVFEQFEEDLYEELTSYDFIASFQSAFVIEVPLRDICKKLAECNQSIISSSERKVLYQQQMNVYKEALSYLNNPKWKWKKVRADLEELGSSLNSQRNHSSYLHEHIGYLHALLSPLLEPYSFSRTEEEPYVYTVRMRAGTVSKVLSKIKLNYSGQLVESRGEVRLLADTVLLLG